MFEVMLVSGHPLPVILSPPWIGRKGGEIDRKGVADPERRGNGGGEGVETSRRLVARPGGHSRLRERGGEARGDICTGVGSGLARRFYNPLAHPIRGL